MTSPRRSSSAGLMLMGILTTLLLSGCQQPLETAYADPSGHSINGISGFIELLKSAGHRTQIWRTVSPRMKTEFDAIILFQTEFKAVPEATLTNIRQLMREGQVRTLLIVVRDSDCSIDYWKQIVSMPELTEADKKAAEESLKDSITELTTDSHPDFDDIDGEYYGLKRKIRKETNDLIRVDIETDEEPIHVEARWRLNRQLEPALDAEVIWSTGDDALLTEEFYYAEKKILVLASAAPILNGGLVDPGNRQLAEALLKNLPEKGNVAIALSSRWSEGTFAQSPSTLEFLKVHPHGWIFGQTFLALALFCWWKLPIFGRPRLAVDSEGARFGRHVEALGKLLQRTRDSTFARLKIREWLGAETFRAGSESVVEPAPETDISDED